MNELELIEKYYNIFSDKMYLAFSGGKDSCVILDLALKINPDIFILHNPKENTHPDTVDFLYTISQKHSVLYLPPAKTSEFIEKNGFECQIDGTRIAEFDRTDKSNDFVKNGKNVNRLEMKAVNECGLFNITHIYPILNWSDQQVFDYIKQNNLPLSKEYNV